MSELSIPAQTALEVADAAACRNGYAPYEAVVHYAGSTAWYGKLGRHVVKLGCGRPDTFGDVIEAFTKSATVAEIDPGHVVAVGLYRRCSNLNYGDNSRGAAPRLEWVDAAIHAPRGLLGVEPVRDVVLPRGDGTSRLEPWEFGAALAGRHGFWQRLLRGTNIRGSRLPAPETNGGGSSVQFVVPAGAGENTRVYMGVHARPGLSVAGSIVPGAEALEVPCLREQLVDTIGAARVRVRFETVDTGRNLHEVTNV